MSAHATIDLLPPTTWDLPQPAPGGKRAAPFRRLVLHHLRLENARALLLPGDGTTTTSPTLLEYTYGIFAAEVEAGRTYPQEADDALAAVAGAFAGGGGGGLSGDSDLSSGRGGDTHTHATRSHWAYTRAAFEAYFWAADVIVAIGQTDDAADDSDGGSRARAQNVGSASASAGWDPLEISRGLGGRRSWEDALVGFYYVKPNYTGRSSHICNAGFIISPAHREFGYGKTLGKSYLHYGPALGYKASVFNLVYANNTGSLRIWDSLGFTRAGLIPRVGRLRRADGNGEEWVDSVIYYRSFVEEEVWTRPIE